MPAPRRAKHVSLIRTAMAENVEKPLVWHGARGAGAIQSACKPEMRLISWVIVLAGVVAVIPAEHTGGDHSSI